MSKYGRQGRSRKGTLLGPGAGGGRRRAKRFHGEAAAPEIAEAAIRDTDPSLVPPEVLPDEPVPARPTLADSPNAVAAAVPVEEDVSPQAPGAEPEAQALPAPREEEVSVPPASDLEAGGFFDSQPMLHEPEIEVDTRDPRLAAKMTAHAARRRAHLSKYVVATVGLMSALLVAALVKGAVNGKQGAELVRKPVAAAQAAAVAAPAPPPVQVQQPQVQQAPAPAVDDEKAVDPQPAAQAADTATAVEAPTPAPTTSAPAADTAPAPVATSTPDTAPADTGAGQQAAGPSDEAPAPDPKAAAKEKAASRNALEWGKVKDSIEAGERSVALDPTDGEAWLILGAAYQQKGDGKEARRCFKACLDQGKRGPKGECSAMLR